MKTADQTLTQLKDAFLKDIQEKYPDHASVFCFLCIDVGIGSVVCEVSEDGIAVKHVQGFDCQGLSEVVSGY